jgi:hypothetical protein
VPGTSTPRDDIPKRSACKSVRIYAREPLPSDGRTGYVKFRHVSRAVAIRTMTYGPFMSQPSSGRPIALIAGALTALAMVALAWPGDLNAACGHGAVSQTERSAGSVVDRLEILAMEPSSDQAIPERPARKPCSGPHCSDGGSSGPNAPIPPSFETGERWLCAVVCPEIAPPRSSRRLPRRVAPIPVNRPAMLERPPRSLPI